MNHGHLPTKKSSRPPIGAALIEYNAALAERRYLNKLFRGSRTHSGEGDAGAFGCAACGYFHQILGAPRPAADCEPAATSSAFHEIFRRSVIVAAHLSPSFLI